MAVTFATISPKNGEDDVPLNSEVVFRLIDSEGAIDLANLTVQITIGNLPELAVDSGVFVNDFDGEFIDNAGDGSDITVVIIRPPTSPNWPEGQFINVAVDVPL